MLNFDFLNKGLGLVYPSHFVYDFSRKRFLMLCSLNDQMLLSDCFYFWRYWAICVLSVLFILCVSYVCYQFCIVIICFADYDVINFEINLSFLMKPFLCMPKTVRTKNLNILRTKRAFTMKEKRFSSF